MNDITTITREEYDVIVVGGGVAGIAAAVSAAREGARVLLMEKQVACVPGTAFGACGEGHIRCSYATSLDNLKEALVRIGDFVASL